jgi:alpha-L-fucosidase
VQTTKLDQALYLPPECDVSIRRGWFWADHDQPKDLDHLLAIHYRSIGMGANLLLNLPPDDRGLIPDEDRERVRQWRAELNRRFAEPIEATLTETASGSWRADFGRPVRIDHLELAEDYSDGQRIRRHRVTTGDTVLAEAMTVGNKRLHVFPAVETDSVTITADGPEPRLSGVRGYATGVESIPSIDYLATTEAPDHS